MEYGNVIYCGSPKKDLNKLIKIEQECKRIITGATFRTSTHLLNNECGWPSIF